MLQNCLPLNVSPSMRTLYPELEISPAVTSTGCRQVYPSAPEEQTPRNDYTFQSGEDILPSSIRQIRASFRTQRPALECKSVFAVTCAHFDRPTRRPYRLKIIQQPLQAASFGDKRLSRVPWSPSLIVQLYCGDRAAPEDMP